MMKAQYWWRMLVFSSAIFCARSVLAEALLYPRSAATIRFDHKKHQQLPCAKCHATTATSSHVSQQSFPTEKVCASCHAGVVRKNETDRIVKDVGRCGFCHVGVSQGRIPVAFVYPAARIHFSHQKHQRSGVVCQQCHDMTAPIRPLPAMQQCLNCHQDRGADRTCASCHFVEKTGRLQTLFEGKKLLPSGSLRPDSHTPQFVRHHAQVARMNQSYCRQCHSDGQCLQCHAGKVRPPQVHFGDYLRQHAFDAKHQTLRCASCHRSQTFCLGCHARAGVMAGAENGPFKPAGRSNFHPEGWVRSGAGQSLHSSAARRNLSLCTSCHTEQSCMQCHGGIKKGFGGISPHPPGFVYSGKCKTLAASNRAMCQRCHVDDAKINACR